MFKSKDYKEKQLRYSIRKVSFGAASVAISALYLLMGSAAVSASEVQAVNGDQTTVTNPAVKDNEDKSRIENNGITTEETNSAVVTLDKTSLTKLIEEIDGKFTNGKYASKTEDSVNQLKAALEAAKIAVSTAKTQAELTQAHANLIVATTKLQTKPEDKKQVPAVDTTNGKATVGIKATNTEKVSDSNSIANSGSRDERNGKVLDANNPFRTDAATTDTDPTANQTYTAPAENADLTTLADKLKNLPNVIENNKKVQDMDTLGNALNVDKGSVKEINEFGGWKAVGDTGKFAIARKTEAGVFPAYTVNINRTNQVWVREQSFDRNSDYILLLAKLVTKQNRTEPVYDNKPYLENNEPGAQTARAAKWFDGIEKTFKAYATNEGTKVTVSFKTGYTGDNNGSKAKYKVEVFSIENGTEKSIYTAVVSPETAVNNSEMKVVAAKDGNARNETFNASGFTKEKIEEKLALPENRPNATGGTFTSREIDLPKGVTSYKVRISLQNKHQAGMSYNSTYLQYSLPITGLDFNVDQDTSVIAKNLLSRIYDKLKATETEDTDGKTNDTKDAYLAELENINTLITSTDVKKTPEYKQALESILSKHLALEVDKTGLTDSKTSLDDLVKEDPTPGKTQDTATAYNTAKQEAIKAIEAAKAVIDNENATVAQVREALATVNAKKTELEAKKQALVEAATTEEKAKLKTDADSLVKADTTGKTPNSIQAYNTKYEELKAQLEAAKTEAATALAKENNASKAEVQAAQTKVDAVKAELTKAAELLVNKADKAELTNAKAALNTLVTEADPTTGKTADSAKTYNDAKTAAAEAIKAAETVINDENATPDQVTEALNKVNEKKTALESAKQALVEAATTEEKAKLKTDADSLVKANETGKTPDSIEAYERKYEELKAQLEAAKTEAATALAKGENATKEEVKAAQAKVDAVKMELENAKNLLVEAATAEEKAKLKTDADLLVKADETGKTADSIKAYESEFEKLKAQLEAAKTEAAAVLAKGDNASKTEAQAAQAKVDAAKSALDKAAESLKDLDRDGAKKEIADAAKKATDAIEASTSLTPEQKAEEKAKVAKEAKDATDAIDNATTEEGINSAKENGKLAIEKEAAITAINAEKAAKEQEIDNNSNLSDEEKAAAKAEVAKAATEAVEAIKKADTKDAVEAAKTKGEAAIKAVNPVGKEKALDAIQKAAEEKIAEIDKNDKLSTEEKAAAKAEVAKAAIKAVEAIQNATTQDAVDTAKADGETAIKAVNSIGKEKALDAIQKVAEEKIAEIDKNDKLSVEEKAAAKAEVAKAAIEAVEAIQKAETQDAVDAAKTKGEEAIKAVNPFGKEQALEAIQTETEAKLAEIDKNNNLSDEEKATAKAEVAKAAIEAVEAIQKAETQEAVNAAQTKGETAIKAVNPVGKEKALEAIQTTTEAKLAEIDKNTSLSPEEKAAAKAEVEKAAKEAVEAIQKADTQEAVNTAQAKGEAAINAINPSGKELSLVDINEAKAAVEAAAAEKIASIKANPNLSDEEKAKAIAEVESLKQKALDAIDKAATKADLDKALRTFLYQLDQDSLVYERPSFDLEAFIQSSITGVVKVERGKAITQAEIISRLNLTENVTVISVDLPDTNTLGRKFAKVTLKLADGTLATVFVPVEVVESSEEHNQQNRQQNNTPVKPQEDAKSAEQPAVNQTEDVKEVSSNTSQKTNGSNQKVLPNTGTGNEISIFGSAAMTVLASLGILATSKKKEEE